MHFLGDKCVYCMTGNDNSTHNRWHAVPEQLQRKDEKKAREKRDKRTVPSKSGSSARNSSVLVASSAQDGL